MRKIVKLLCGSLVTTAALGAGGCSQGSSSHAEAVGQGAAALDTICGNGGPCTLTFTVPQGLSPQDVVLSTTTSMTVGTSATVNTDTGGFGAVANFGLPVTLIGNSANVGNLFSVAAVNLGTSATVHGNLESGGLVASEAGAKVTGTTSQLVTVASNTSVSTVVTFPAPGANVSVASGHSQTLTPGSYGAVTVSGGGTLTLSAGSYQFTSLTVQAGGTLSLNETAGPILTYIHAGFQFAGTETQTGGDGNVLFAVFGTGAMTMSTPLHATINAPNSLLTLSSSTGAFRGAFFADSILVTPGTTVTGAGALTPASTGGLTPTVNCVATIDSTHTGAVLGYKNTSGAAVTLGVGAHNAVSPGAADRQQPIQFSTGTAPITAFISFPTGSHLAWTLGNQSALATSSSPVCPAGLTTGLLALSTPTAASQAVEASLVTVLQNPNTPALLANLQGQLGSKITPFETALFAAANLAVNNVDLIATPSGSYTPAQAARFPAFQQSMLSNQAVLALRVAGDQTRATPATLSCGGLSSANSARALVPLAKPPTDSIYGELISASTSAAFESTRTAIGAVLNNSSEAAALQAMPGTALVSTLPQSTFLGSVNLPGTIPTGSVVSGVVDIVAGAVAVVAGAVVGVVGAIACIPSGGAGCAVAGGGAYAFWVGLNLVAAGIGSVDGSCPNANPFPGCALGLPVDSCGQNATCIGACCYATGSGQSMGNFDPGEAQELLTAGAQCIDQQGLATGTFCVQDSNCPNTSNGQQICMNGCCGFPSFSQCSGHTCSTDANCSNGDTCSFGCCTGVCGVGGQACDTNPSTSCGTPRTCPAGDTCTNGCCVAPSSPPPK